MTASIIVAGTTVLSVLGHVAYATAFSTGVSLRSTPVHVEE